MATIVNDYYKAELAVMHMGDIFTMGPEEAAFAVNKLIKPKSVIPEHANEAATAKGVVQAGTRTARFIDLVKGPRFTCRSAASPCSLTLTANVLAAAETKYGFVGWVEAPRAATHRWQDNG